MEEQLWDVISDDTEELVEDPFLTQVLALEQEQQADTNEAAPEQYVHTFAVSR